MLFHVTSIAVGIPITVLRVATDLPHPALCMARPAVDHACNMAPENGTDALKAFIAVDDPRLLTSPVIVLTSETISLTRLPLTCPGPASSASLLIVMPKAVPSCIAVLKCFQILHTIWTPASPVLFWMNGTASSNISDILLSN